MFRMSGVRYARNGELGKGDGPIVLANLQCAGIESRLHDCPMSVWGEHSSICNHNNDAGCWCRSPGEFVHLLVNPNNIIIMYCV